MKSGQRRVVMLIAFWVTNAVPWRVTAEVNNVVPYEDAASRIMFHVQGWGEMGVNTCAHAPGVKPMALQICDQAYEKGLGVHAPSETWIDLEGRFLSFQAEIGVQRQAQGVGSVVFQVYVDGEKCFDSGVMTEHDEARPVCIPVEGAQELRLIVTDAGDGITCDCANWAQARLITNPNAPAATPALGPDMAPFARVMTWDPSRKEGTRAMRTEEFPEEDIFLGQELVPNRDGAFEVTADENGACCVGLEWAERRLISALGLHVAAGQRMPGAHDAYVEFWQGESPWQGAWKRLDAAIRVVGSKWEVRVNPVGNADLRGGTERIRWIFPGAPGPIRICSLSAHTRSRWETVDLRVEVENSRMGHIARVEAYNGWLLVRKDAGMEEDWALSCSWDPAHVLGLRVRYCALRPWKTDRTILRFELAGTAFGVAVDDVLASDSVYVPHAGLLVVRKDSPDTLAVCRESVGSRKTILEEVRERADQTLVRAMAHVHNPIQNNGPMMLSLACDNRKFVAHRDGAVTFDIYDAPDQGVGMPDTFRCRLRPSFGSGQTAPIARQLHGGWLPAPVTTVNDEGVAYTQTAFVVPFDKETVAAGYSGLRARALCIVNYSMENTESEEVFAGLRLAFSFDVTAGRVPEVHAAEGGVVVVQDGRLLAFVMPENGLDFDIESGAASWKRTLKARQTVRCNVFLPAWDVKTDEYVLLKKRVNWLRVLERYWQGVLSGATHIDVPDEFLGNVIRASQVHCLIAARNESGGARVAPWIASASYGPLESEANSIIRGMDLLGHDEFARRSLDFFLARYNEKGYLTTGYTVMGTGWNLWTLAEHYERTRDDDWLRQAAPTLAKACDWIVRQREKTVGADAYGQALPESGLVPPGVAADWNRYAYRFAYEAHFCAGLRGAAEALKTIAHPEAERFLKEGDAFREDILRAYRWNQARSPVLPLRNGAWVPAYPGMLYCFGRIEDVIPGEDWNRSWAYDVELGAHHLAALGVLDARSPGVEEMLDHMEDSWFLHSGMGDYPAEKNQADWFNLGGFAKVQPYYARNAELYALRDDVKPFIRSYFNAIFSLLNLETLSFWEHFHNIGAWNKTHETGYFLAQTRLMLLMERGGELWLAPFIPAEWLGDGKHITVRRAPTRFGCVSYTIQPRLARGIIKVDIAPPERERPDHIIVRLRHPEGQRIVGAVATGARECHVAGDDECVHIAPAAGRIELEVRFRKPRMDNMDTLTRIEGRDDDLCASRPW